ncbi:NADPH-dependent F420 reductase [Gilliamella sp. Pas-s27]|uniref:NADPH-dependent F420 reductase n=1 Tax=Gilliamella sp. Pas-s27 TaxID=2687311 RepID=UPI0013659239|nr:NAD(P)-binding domain-containing protein [Gilliamella sp. Pas-s27]MWP45935.1 NADP oxidoreductase [Gilliamella sp. Pas-s27]
MKKIGIIGAGFVSQACATLFMQAGYQVMLSNSRDKSTLFSVATRLNCQIGSQEEAIKFADIILVAIPFINYTHLPTELLRGKIVLDATNYYPERDGYLEPLDKYEITTSELMAKHLNKSKVVKVFNAILAKDVVKDAKPNDQSDRRAIPIAGNDLATKQTVINLLENIGYDYVDVGALSNSWRFERAKPAYCIPLNRQQLNDVIAQTTREFEVPHNSWQTNNQQR